jgi:hypothetical protein
LIGAILSASSCVALSQSVDESKPYGRVCFSVMDSTTGEEEVLNAGAAPKNGKTLIAHIDASAKCEAVVAAFNRKNGQLANGWRPQCVELPQWEEMPLPKAPVTWPYVKNDEPLELYVLFFVPDSKEIGELKKLVQAMAEPKSAERLVRMQTNKLHELIGHAVSEKDRSKYLAKVETVEVGGISRGDSFEWRKFARSVNFAPEKPGVLIFTGATAR